MKLGIKVVGADGTVKASIEDTKEAILCFNKEYEEGDIITFNVEEPENHFFVKIDEAIDTSMVYIVDDEFSYEIPFGDKKICYPPTSFTGNIHCLSIREANEWEVDSYRNLAANPLDQRGETRCFPHAFANVETRGESVFAARNAIDGLHANTYHGEWPYGSWGINRRDDAEIVVAFGREIVTDRVVIYTRADFPHDNWWVKATLEFSDETTMEVELNKTHKAQEFAISPAKHISWIKMKEMIKADDPSPFPALTQLEVYGKESKKN